MARAAILTPPRDGEPLYLYVTTTTQVVTAVIVVERTKEGHTLPVQRPSCIPHQRGAVRDQGALPANPEASLCGGARKAQAPVLLRGPPSYGSLLLPVGEII
jgi:hypothetical protein